MFPYRGGTEGTEDLLVLSVFSVFTAEGKDVPLPRRARRISCSSPCSPCLRVYIKWVSIFRGVNQHVHYSA